MHKTGWGHPEDALKVKKSDFQVREDFFFLDFHYMDDPAFFGALTKQEMHPIFGATLFFKGSGNGPSS